MEIFTTHTFLTLFYALLGGVIPVLVWLFFWTTEDREHPEPKKMIALAFLGGIIAVIISLIVEKLACGSMCGASDSSTLSYFAQSIFSPDFMKPFLSLYQKVAIISSESINNVILVLFLAPIIEEVAKFVMAYILVLRSKEDDEPIDPVIYMITCALGFSAIENMLFLIDPINKNNVVFSIITGNMRFIGATLLHTISSAVIGAFIGFNLFNKKIRRDLLAIIGIIAAIVIHSAFNFFMIMSPKGSFIALEAIWVGVIIILFTFEKIKKIKIEKIQE